ncbi:MAG: PAS domain S-box protein [Acetobacteraceae bacterium]
MFDGSASTLGNKAQPAHPLAWHLFRLCIALVLPVLLFAVALAWLYVDSQRASLETTAQAVARGAAHAVDRELTRATIAGKMLAQSRSIAVGNLERVAQRAAGLREELGLDVRLYDQTGHLLVDTAKARGDAQPPVRPPLADASQANQPAISDYVVDTIAGPGAQITVPVRDAQQVTHLLVIPVPASRIREIAHGRADKWMTIITDRLGVIVARSEGLQPPVGQPFPPALMAETAGRETGIVVADDLDGHPVLAAFSRLPTSGWAAWAVAPVAQMDSPLKQSIGALLALAALLTVLSSALATHFARRIARSVGALRAQAAGLRAGEAVTPPPSDVAELWDVSQALALAAADRLAAEAQLQEQNLALKHASKRQEDILDALPALVVLLDGDGRIAAVNEGWRTNPRVGPAQRSMVGDDYLAACLPGARAGDAQIKATLEGLQEVVAGRRQRFETIYTLAPPGGDPCWFQCIAVAHAVDHAAGATGGAVVMHLDMTKQVQTQETLAEREAQLRLFIERTPAAIAVFDTDMRYLSVSRRFLADYGLDTTDPNALLGRSHYDVFPDMMEHWRAVHRRVLVDGETLSAQEEAFPRHDGRIDWVRWEMTPWRHRGGSIGGAVLFTEMVTERKQAEAALRNSEARLRLAIEATGLGTLDEDLLSGRAVWNNTAFRILGLERASTPLSRKDWRDSVHPDDRDRVQDAYLAARSAGTLFQCEHRIIRPTGEVRWIRPLGRFLQGAFGEALRFVGVFSDITSLKHASERQERLLQLIEQSNDFIALADASGQLTYMNRGGRQMIGLGADADLSALNFADYVAPESRDLFETTVVPTIVAQGLWEGEMQLVHQRTGARIDIFRSTFALRDETGLVSGFGTVSRDITTAKQAEAALAESEARLRSILESVPDGMVLSDETGTIQSFSATAELLFGWSASEVVGRNVSVLMASPDRDHHDVHMARYIESGIKRVIGTGRTVTGLRKNGSTFPLEISLCELRVGGRRLFTAFLRDLTERLATQARMQQMQAELAHVSRLSAAGAMGSALAHELNQPLTAIASAVRAARRMLGTAKMQGVPPSLIDAMDLASDQALRAGQIVRRLREFVARGGDTDRQVESLSRLIEDASALALAGTRERGLRAQFLLPEELPPVIVDRVQIQQVLVNLIRNAVQAMTDEPEDVPPGLRREPELIVAARVADDEAVEVSVSDNGPGLPPTVLDRLFEPFVTTRVGGMGVGLSICQSIIRAHGGQLWAEAHPSGGTIFRFTLPSAHLEPMLTARHADDQPV